MRRPGKIVCVFAAYVRTVDEREGGHNAQFTRFGLAAGGTGNLIINSDSDRQQKQQRTL